jgi:hypothetical protein
MVQPLYVNCLHQCWCLLWQGKGWIWGTGAGSMLYMCRLLARSALLPLPVSFCPTPLMVCPLHA